MANAISAYQLTVTRLDGSEVHFVPGGHGVRDLRTLLMQRVAAKGVGIGRTTAHVLMDVGDALDELFASLTNEVLPRD